MIRLCVCVIGIIAGSMVHAADLCVSVSGSGSQSGADWNNTLAQGFTPSRGNVYYYADGTYSGKTLSTSVSGVTPITLKKAIEEEHGPSTGWSSAYGDGQATFAGITITTDYWELNGQTRDENDWLDGTAYGMLATNISIGVNVDNCTFRYIAVDANNTGTCINLNTQGNSPWRSTFLFHRMLLTEAGFAFHSRETSNVTIEYTHLGPTISKECISHQFGHNWVIRWCRFIDFGIGTGPDTQTACLGVFNFSGGGDPEDTDADNWEIYGCLFAGGPNAASQTAQDGLFLVANGHNWKIYNCTVYNVGGNWGGYFNVNGTGNIVRNVLLSHQRTYNEEGSVLQITGIGPSNTDETWIYKGPQDLPYHSSSGPPWIAGTVIVGSEDPFQDKANGDFRLKTSFSGNSPLDVGSAVGAPYNQDMNGVTHDNIGAFATFGEGGGGTPGSLNVTTMQATTMQIQ